MNKGYTKGITKMNVKFCKLDTCLKEENGNYSIEIPDNYDRQKIYKAFTKSFGTFGYDPAFHGRSNLAYDNCSAHPEMWKEIMLDKPSS